MSRLADYFCVIGVEDSAELYNQKELKGCVIQKFPENDWKNIPSPQGLEHFCQPAGWYATKKNRPPTFTVSILTDMEGKPSYLACLTFYEAVQQVLDESELLDSKLVQPGAVVVRNEKKAVIYYTPKCLCLISRHRYYNILKNCLATIFTAYLNNSTELVEKMVGHLLGFLHVPPAGGPKLVFSLGGGDSQVLQPPLSADIPSTNESVAVLFNQLGISSIINVFTALVTESKILLLSSSYTHLTMAAEALTSLLYPLTYNYVFIPILPHNLLDFLSAPTPFLMGVHMSYENLCPELFDIVIVNIDEGHVIIPDSVHLATIPEPYYTNILKSLKLILTPSLYTSDLLFPTLDPPSPLALQDKQLRAVFVKLFAEMFCGYRACLTLIRVHPKPVISFNKLAFMEKRGVIGDEFFSKVLDSIGFSVMTQTRGPPYREVDMFDQLIASIRLSSEDKTVNELMNDLIPIADHLCQNEPWLDSPESSSIPDVSHDALRRPLKAFPLLNEIKINNFLKKPVSNVIPKAYQPPERILSQVPINVHDHYTSHFINERRLGVIQDCLQYIYESKISEARKALPSVLRALKSKGAQFALCNQLELRIKDGNAMLDNDQYNLIIKLINAALQDENTVSSSNIAAKMIPLVSAFHRKLGPSVIQFAFTSVQDHAIWSNLQFWEEAFYAEAQRQIVELHVKERIRRKAANSKAAANDSPEQEPTDVTEDEKDVKEMVEEDFEDVKAFADKTLNVSDVKNNHRNSLFFSPATPSATSLRIRPATSNNNSSSTNIKAAEKAEGSISSSTKDLPDAMKLAADLLSEWDKKTEDEQQLLIYEEESIIYSLTMLFAQRMMYLRVPTNSCVEMRKMQLLKRKEYERRMQQQQLLKAEGGDSALATDDTQSVSTRPANSIINDAASTYMGESVIGGGSSGWGSMLDLGDGSMDFGESVKDATSKFILRFVERVCIEAAVTPAHLKSLQTNIPMLVGMHIESLEEVYRETKDAPTQKAKILKPALLHGEELQFDGLRCYLIADGRELGVRREVNVGRPNDHSYDDDTPTGADIGGPCLLPAEGALFLTNYRVIFKGTPVDQFASEMTVTRSFPIGALLSEKKILDKKKWENTVFSYPLVQEQLLQLRASTMQLLRLTFDEEVSPEKIDNFRKSLVKLRWPPSVYNTFAFNYKAPPILQRTLSQRQQSIRKTHRTLSNVVNLTKKVTTSATSSVKGRHKNGQVDDNTTRKYESVGTDSSLTAGDGGNDYMQLVRFEQEHRGADRLRESVLCKDYERLGFGGITKIVSSVWRLSMANFHYSACRSYPAILVLPHNVADDTILKVAKNHRLSRFPVAVWRHRKTKGTLLRSGAINKSVLAAVLRAGVRGDKLSQGYLTTSVTDDEKLYQEIISATHLYTLKGKHQTVSAGAALSMTALSDDFSTMFDGSDTFSRMVDAVDGIKNWVPARLYIFTDRTSKLSRMESSNKVVVVNVEIHDVAEVKTSYKRLTKICNPSSSTAEEKFLSLFEESKWMSQISSLLQVACSVVNLIDIQGSSCLISFGDGSEVTSQVVSLVQLLSDPYYRTIKGFKVLIEKDWLAFGYRFSHRGNHIGQQQQIIAPFFLQFLDCVQQICLQYPHAFEFNNYFLKFIAYHQTSMRFNTFFLDSEHERYQHGWFPDTDTTATNDETKTRANGQANKRTLGLPRQKKDGSIKEEQLAQQHEEQKQKKLTSVSLWDYLSLQANKFTLFQSFLYHPNLHKGVLQPFCNISNLEIWDFYTTENLYTGPSYDLELVSDFEMANPSNDPSMSASTNTDVDREDSQRCLTGCYGNTLDFPRDEATYLLSELSRLKEELDQNPPQWRDTWDSLNVKDTMRRRTRTIQWHAYWLKERRAALHKRTTIDVVLKGKVTETSQVRSDFGFEYPHDFVLTNHVKSSICNYCLQAISPGYHTGLQCSQCGYNAHGKCQSMVPAHCDKHTALIDQPGMQMSRSSHSISGGQPNPRNFKGTLYKRGHRLKRWNPRWFVLDAERNQLTYYDSEGDSQLQGYVNLGEMRGCRMLNKPPPHGPKWCDPRAYFELETTKRIYHLLAPKAETAQEWVERLRALNT